MFRYILLLSSNAFSKSKFCLVFFKKGSHTFLVFAGRKAANNDTDQLVQAWHKSAPWWAYLVMIPYELRSLHCSSWPMETVVIDRLLYLNLIVMWVKVRVSQSTMSRNCDGLMISACSQFLIWRYQIVSDHILTFNKLPNDCKLPNCHYQTFARPINQSTILLIGCMTHYLSFGLSSSFL